MQEHIKPREPEPLWHALLLQVASCKNEDVMSDLDGTLKIKVDCMERFAQAVARECISLGDALHSQSTYGPTAHGIRQVTDAIGARFGLGE